MAESIRTFIAIELPEPVKQELTDLETVLKKRCPPVVKWVEPSGIHLTLKFLGSVDADRIEEIEMAIDEAVRVLRPLVWRCARLVLFLTSTACRLSG